MSDQPDSFVIGEILFTGGLDELSAILDASGMSHSVGAYAIRLNGFPAGFEIAWVGNLSPDSPYQVDGCGYGMPHQTVALWCARLASILQAHGIKYDFAHCDEAQDELGVYTG